MECIMQEEMDSIWNEQITYTDDVETNDGHLTPPALNSDSRTMHLRSLPACVENPVKRQVCSWVGVHLALALLVFVFVNIYDFE